MKGRGKGQPGSRMRSAAEGEHRTGEDWSEAGPCNSPRDGTMQHIETRTRCTANRAAQEKARQKEYPRGARPFPGEGGPRSGGTPEGCPLHPIVHKYENRRYVPPTGHTEPRSICPVGGTYANPKGGTYVKLIHSLPPQVFWLLLVRFLKRSPRRVGDGTHRFQWLGWRATPTPG